MTGVVSLFVVLLVWRFFIVLGETVFAAAGLPPRAAAFEARSALVGAGYTTSQSEYVVRDLAARRVASVLVVFGYFGPPVVLALLGVSFVVPTGEDRTAPAVTLLGLIVGLTVLDRTGVIRRLGSRPARAIARRLMASDAFDTWIEVGDHAVAATVIPRDPERAEPMLAALRTPGVKILAVEVAAPGSGMIPDDVRPIVPQPGERVVVFGPTRVFDALRSDTGVGT